MLSETSHLPTGSAVMSPPGEGELAGADHTHGGTQVRDPNWGFRTQESLTVISFSLHTEDPLVILTENIAVFSIYKRTDIHMIMNIIITEKTLRLTVKT